MTHPRRSRYSLIFTLLLICLSLPLQAVAAQCLTRTCVDVYIENGQIVIEGHKGSGKKSTAQVKKRVLQPEKIAPLPKPRATTTRRSPAGAVVRRAVPRKKILRKITRRVAPAISLSDKLVKLLPTASIARQPDQGALVNVPVIYWSDLPTVFTTRVSIVGEIVDVTMRPSFLWSFGDGTFFATTEAGRPYPEENITHIYSRAGTYLVTMLATWGGTWSHNGVARAITGQIRKLSVATLSVANGPTRITK